VIIIKENRSFDNYFGTFPGANGATSGMAGSKQIPLGHDALSSRDIIHGWIAANTAIDGGKMDGFYKLAANYASYVQFQQGDIPNYWQYAQTFTLADNFFESNLGPSFPNHVYFAAADSDDIISNPINEPENGNAAWGCDSASTAYVKQANPKTGKITNIFPCFDIPTLPDSLDAAGLAWRYYSASPGQYGFTWSVLDAIKHIRYGSQWTTNVLPVGNFIHDVQTELAPVTWITPPGTFSDHPPNNVCAGEGWTVNIVNAIMQSPFWNSTAIFIAWDDFGGYYDHVPPPSVDYFGLGIRVPLLIISPYVNAGTVQHEVSDFSSLLAFTESVSGLPPLRQRDKIANNLMGAFNFNQQPLPPLILNPRKCPKVRQLPIEPLPDDDGD